ncbi:hypothetical protein M8044_000120 [Columbia Basin potato purple top phytoplasma]|uniref:Uncharacterized protein n=1 Tax=Columbia Basin potato purple top phytoplasma TaxID=307134 RepID=A0ABT5L898_9MOLU|nr:hypothetical protein [Columbia Basin potato purple top phytoplasma]
MILKNKSPNFKKLSLLDIFINNFNLSNKKIYFLPKIILFNI